MDDFFEALFAGIGHALGYIVAEVVGLLFGWQGLLTLFVLCIGLLLWFG